MVRLGSLHLYVDLLGRMGRIESTCPVTNKTISFILGPDGVKGLVPANTVISVLVPDKPITADVRLCFCHFFASAEAGARWVSKQEGTFVLLSLENAISLMRMVDNMYFGDALRERPARAEAKLTGAACERN